MTFAQFLEETWNDTKTFFATHSAHAVFFAVLPWILYGAALVFAAVFALRFLMWIF